ncbi:MAG: chemotaxis protein [Christensenellaceae bacterium]|jgi:two-component system chemotaxis response regulator CheV
MEEIKKQEIIEPGTNEMEIVEFTISGDVFGINVAKILEIMMVTKIKPMPHSHPAVEGVFKPRDTVLTVINLPQYLGLAEPPEHDAEKDLLIVTHFNQMQLAFRVHTVEGIRKITWADIEKPDKTVSGGMEGIITGLASFENRLITILDFEKIVTEIAPETGIQLDEVEEYAGDKYKNYPILIAEDSRFLTGMLLESLHRAGFDNIRTFDNGQEAWNFLESIKDDEVAIDNDVRLVITDIEMPQMDGYRLIKLIREERNLKHLPVIIFSSILSDEMILRGNNCGADAQLSKPEIAKLVSIVHQLFGKHHGELQAEAQ